MNAPRVVRALATSIGVLLFVGTAAATIAFAFRPGNWNGKAIFELVAITGLGCVAGTGPLGAWLFTGAKFMDAWAKRLEKDARDRPTEF